jgi:hypothetical protein
MLTLNDIGLHEQVFTHVYEGVATMVAAERMQKSDEYKALEIVVTPVEEHFAKWCMENRGIEQRRLDRITLQHLIISPLCYCEFPRPESLGGGMAHMLTDGNHRYVKASMLGMLALPARVAPETLWRKFQVDGIPVEIAEFFVENDSGIP